MPNENVTDLQEYRLQLNLDIFHGAQRFLPGHALRAGRDFDWPILERSRGRAETHPTNA
jgi:hypothetical protein